MSEFAKNGKKTIGYEYKEAFVDRDKVSLYLDAYESFGWVPDESGGFSGRLTIPNIPSVGNMGKIPIRMKRDRKIINKAELTRLQRHFEACVHDIDEIEKSKTRGATIASIIIGIIGTAFMAGSVFAVVAEPPRILLCIILGIPAFVGWIVPYFAYKTLVKRKAAEANERIEQKYDEIYEICEKGSRLL